nr:cytochrome P450 [Nocardia flavorosea]
MRSRVLAQPPAGSGLKPVHGTYLPTPREVLWALRAPEKAIARRRELFGDISFMYSPLEGKLVNPAGPDGCAAVALNKDKAFASEPGWGLMIGRFFRRGLLLMDFDEHRYHRLILQQAFTADQLRGYLAQMQPMVRQRIAELPVGDGIRIHHELKKLTLDIALESFLGLKISRAEADRVNKAFIDCVQACLALIRYDVPGTRWSRGLAGRRELERFLRRHLPAKRAARTPDLFSTLCHLNSEEGHGLTDDEIIDHLIFVLMAAHDTSTITLATMTYYLARHPEWQERARAQSRELPAMITYEALPGYSVLDRIMKESLRLNPPVPGLVRQAIEDTEIDGYFIPKGTRVTAMPLANHYNPDLWTAPETFDPDRFSDERAEDKSHRFAWMPFGGGVHKCIGLYFGQMEVKTIMHHLLLTHEWSVPASYTWQLDYTTLPVPRDGLPVRLKKL